MVSAQTSPLSTTSKVNSTSTYNYKLRYTVNYAIGGNSEQTPGVETVVSVTNQSSKTQKVDIWFRGTDNPVTETPYLCVASGVIPSQTTVDFATWDVVSSYNLIEFSATDGITGDLCASFEGRAELWSTTPRLQIDAAVVIPNTSNDSVSVRSIKVNKKKGVNKGD